LNQNLHKKEPARSIVLVV